MEEKGMGLWLVLGWLGVCIFVRGCYLSNSIYYVILLGVKGEIIVLELEIGFYVLKFFLIKKY